LIELISFMLWLIFVAVFIAPLIRTLFVALAHIACIILYYILILRLLRFITSFL